MAWPQWGAGAQMSSLMPAVNAAPPVAAAPLQQAGQMLPAGYTPEQYQQLQQQNWQQWAQWQQQYQQWQHQYGEQYQKLAATGAVPPVGNMMGSVAGPPPLLPNAPPALPGAASRLPGAPPPLLPGAPPMPPGAPPLPTEANPPPPPPPDDHFNQPQQRGGQQPQNNRGPQRPPGGQQWQSANQKRPFNQGHERDGSKRQMTSQGQWNAPNKGKGPVSNQSQQEKPPMPGGAVNHAKKLEELSEAEGKFDKEFAAWEAQFIKWKEQNASHPDKTQYREYEKKWESWRNSLLDRREQMRKKRLTLQSAMEAASKPPPPLMPPSQQPPSFVPPSQQPPSFIPPSQQPPSFVPPSKPPPSFVPTSQPPPSFVPPSHPPHGAKPPPLMASQAPLLEKPLDITTKPPPTQNNEPLSFNPPKKYPGEEVVEVSEEGDGFLKTSGGYDGIPGLDCEKDVEVRQDHEEGSNVSKPSASKNEKGPDFDAISKGINTILGDPKLLNMLSMVSQNQNFANSVVTNTTPRAPDRISAASSVNPSQYEHSNQSYDGYDENQRAPREDVHNFDDQTRMSFSNGPNDQDPGYGNNNSYGRGPPGAGFGKRPPNANFAKFGGPDNDSFVGRPPNNQFERFGRGDGPDDSFGGRPPNNERFGRGDGPGDNFRGGPPNNERFGRGDGPGDNFGGGPPNNERFGRNNGPDDSFGGRPPNNERFGRGDGPGDTFGGRPTNNKRFGRGDGPDDSFGGRPLNNERFGRGDGPGDAFGGRPPNNERFGRGDGPGDAFGGRPPNNERFGRGDGPDDSFGGRPSNSQFDRFGNQNFNRDDRAPNREFDRFDRGDGKFGKPSDNRNGGRGFNKQNKKGNYGDNYDEYDDYDNRGDYDDDRYEGKFNKGYGDDFAEDDDYDRFHSRFNQDEEKRHNQEPLRPRQQPPSHFGQQPGPNQSHYQDQHSPAPQASGPNPTSAIPSLFDLPMVEPPPQVDLTVEEPVEQQVPEEVVAPEPPPEEELFVPEVVVDYEHKPIKPPEPEVSLEPIYTYDYRNKPVSRIPYPQRPRWLYDAVKNITQFDPLGTTRFGFDPPISSDRPMYDQRPIFDQRSAPFPDQRVPPYERPPIPLDCDLERGRYPPEDRGRYPPEDRGRYPPEDRGRYPPADRSKHPPGDRGRYPPERDQFKRRPEADRFESKRSFDRDLDRGRPRDGPDNRGRERYDRDRKKEREPDRGRGKFDRDRNRRRSRSRDRKSPDRRSRRDMAERKDDFEDLSDGDFDDETKSPAKGGLKFSPPRPLQNQLERISPDLSLASNPSNPGEKSNEPALIEDLLYAPGRFNRPSRIVIILRGPPGSGKTFLAKLIKDKEIENGGSAPRILSLDDYFMVEHEEQVMEDGVLVKVKRMSYEYEAEMEESYRQSLIKAFKKTVLDGYFPFIVVDNVNDKVRNFGEMWSYAKQNGFQVYICQMDLDPEQCTRRNIHNRSQKDIEDCIAAWEPTPAHHPTIDATNFLQNAIPITEVEMEVVEPIRDDVVQDEAMEGDAGSKWDSFDCSQNNLARLDGVNKPLKPSRTMEEYLQLDDEWEEPVEPLKPGKKRVRWADLEEQKQQKKMRAMGFIVGQTDWNRMTDQSDGQNALNKTKYIERVRKN